MEDREKPREADLQAHADCIAEQIREFNAVAEQLGLEHEVEFKPGMDLEPYTELESKRMADGLSLKGFVTIFVHTSRNVSLEKLNGKWGLYYALTSLERRSPAATKVRLQDAPLEMRERFVDRVDDFFTQYEGLVKDATEARRERVDRMVETRNKGEEALVKWRARASQKGVPR